MSHAAERTRAGVRRNPVLGGLAATAAAVTVAALATLAPANALAVGGTTTLALSGPAAKSLRDAGVRIAPVKPARGGAQRIVLPIAAGLAGTKATLLRHRGGIALDPPAGRTRRMGKLRLLLGRRSRLSATLGGREVDLFRVLGRRSPSMDPIAGTLELRGMRLQLTRAGAAAVERLLRATARRARQDGRRSPAATSDRPFAEVQPGRFGTLSSRATGLPSGGSPVGGAGEGGQADKSTGCPQPSGAGPVAESSPQAMARPSGAIDITGATVDWHVRESFVRYVNTGEGTSVSGGATADPAVLLPGASAPLTYAFHFPFAEGWHDPGASPSDLGDDRAAIYFGGAVRFLYSGHEIDLTTAEPEIEIAGGASRAIFAIAEAPDPAQRQVLVNLDLSRAESIRSSGSSFVYERVPAAIPAGAASSVFGGFYAPGAEFGCFTVAYRTG